MEGRPWRGKIETTARVYDTPHDRAAKAANWAMQEDPECAAAHRLRMAAKEELALASRHEVPKARAALEAANAEWRRVTKEVFDRVMTEAGFPPCQERATAAEVALDETRERRRA